MATNATHHTRQVLENVERIVAIELLAAAQAVDLRREQVGSAAQLGKGTAAAYACVREHIPFLEHDTYLAPYLEAATRLVADGTLIRAVQG